MGYFILNNLYKRLLTITLICLTTLTSTSYSTEVENKINITPEQYKELAKKVLAVRSALSGKYSYSDNTTFGLYLLKALAEIGEYKVPNEDIVKLMKAVKELTGEEYNPTFLEFMKQVDSLKFGKRGRKYFVKIYAKEKKDIVIKFNSQIDENTELISMVAKHKSILYFSEKKSKHSFFSIKRFVTGRARAFFFNLDRLNLVHPSIIKNVESYLDSEKTVNPLVVKYDGIFFRVKTDTIFKTLDFYLKKSVSMPELKNDEGALPSFVASARAKFIRLKISIDN